MTRLLPAGAIAIALAGVSIQTSAATAAASAAEPRATASAAWRPDVRAAARYAARRRGSISFAVRTGDRQLFGTRVWRTAPSASVLKAMLLVAYLNRREVRRRPLRRADLRLISPMVRRSDNRTAYRIRVLVGASGLRRVARSAGMRSFRPAAADSWGQSRISAADQSRFFLRFEDRVVPRHRATALRLLRRIVTRQRWGIGRVRLPRGWQLFFKGGWGSGTGATDHQVALLRRGSRRVAVAILTEQQGSHAYGKATLRGVAKRLLRGLR